MMCPGRSGPHGVHRGVGTMVCIGRIGYHAVQSDGWVSWCAHGGMGPMLYTGRDEFHHCPPGLEVTGRAKSYPMSTEHALPLDSRPAQDFLTFLNLHLCVKDYIQS